jgi:exonuclease VII small subunit
MSERIDEVRSELEAAQSALDAALSAWDQSVSDLWRTSLTVTQAQKRVTRAHELLRIALDEADENPQREQHVRAKDSP